MLRKPSDNWPHLRTTNPIESTFATVRLRTARIKDADVNAENVKGLTPLYWATGHKEIVELFISNGADVNAVDVQPQTPLDWAIEANRTETADLLRKHGGKTGEELKAEGK